MSSPKTPVRRYGRYEQIRERGQETREKLLDVLAEALEEMPYSDLHLVDICHRIERAPGTFHQYFRNLDEAVEALEYRTRERNEELGPMAAAVAEFRRTQQEILRARRHDGH